MTPAVRASERLLDEKEALARAVTDALYDADPTLLDRFGEAGRAHCLQDMRYNLEHLAPAVDLGRPDMFAGYVRWLDGLLRARGVPTDEVVRCLEATEAELRARFSADEADAALPCIRAGLAVLAGAGEEA